MTSPTVLVLCLCGAAVVTGQQMTADLRTGTVTGDVTPANGFQWVIQPPQNLCNAACNLRGLLKITFNKSTRRHVQINMTFASNPSRFTFNIGDSKSNDGYAGDYEDQSNDAEMHSLDRTILFYGKEIRPNLSYGLLYRRDNFIRQDVTIDIMDELAVADNGNDYLYINSFKMFALNGQPDPTGPVNYDIYLSTNSVITGRSDRMGDGLCKVSIGWIR